MKKMLFTIFLLVTTAGCGNKIKQKIGLTATAPDEFQVKRYKPLEVPPHYELSEPSYKSKETEPTDKGNLSKADSDLLRDIDE